MLVGFAVLEAESIDPTAADPTLSTTQSLRIHTPEFTFDSSLGTLVYLVELDILEHVHRPTTKGAVDLSLD